MRPERKTLAQLSVKAVVYRAIAVVSELLLTYLWFHGSVVTTLVFAPVIVLSNFIRTVVYLAYDLFWLQVVRTRWHIKQRVLHRLHINGNGAAAPATSPTPPPSSFDELEKEVESLFTQPPPSGGPGT